MCVQYIVPCTHISVQIPRNVLYIQTFCETETKFMHPPCVLHLPFVCTVYYTHTQETHTALGCVCLSDPSGPVWFSYNASDEWRAESGSTATRTHGNTPSTLSATTLFIPRIYLSVRQRPGKSLTRRPSGFLNATDQTESEKKTEREII